MAQRTSLNRPYGLVHEDDIVRDITELFSMTGEDGELLTLSGVLNRGNNSGTYSIEMGTNTQISSNGSTSVLKLDAYSSNSIELHTNDSYSPSNPYLFMRDTSSDLEGSILSAIYLLGEDTGAGIKINNTPQEVIIQKNNTSPGRIVVGSSTTIGSDDGQTLTISDSFEFTAGIFISSGAGGYIDSRSNSSLYLGTNATQTGIVDIGNTSYPVTISGSKVSMSNLPTYSDNTAATGGGLVANDLYKTPTGELRIVV